MSNFLNANGLIDGSIPAGDECPFWTECNAKNKNCPIIQNGNIRENPFSCAFARAHSICKEEK